MAPTLALNDVCWLPFSLPRTRPVAAAAAPPHIDHFAHTQLASNSDILQINLNRRIASSHVMELPSTLLSGSESDDGGSSIASSPRFFFSTDEPRDLKTVLYESAHFSPTGELGRVGIEDGWVDGWRSARFAAQRCSHVVFGLCVRC